MARGPGVGPGCSTFGGSTGLIARISEGRGTRPSQRRQSWKVHRIFPCLAPGRGPHRNVKAVPELREPKLRESRDNGHPPNWVGICHLPLKREKGFNDTMENPDVSNCANRRDAGSART
jgi:hypothetical protein